MRHDLLALPLLLIAAPAVAALAPAPERIEIPPQLTDPALGDRLADMIGAMTDAFLDIPVGGLEAAAQGREPTPGERSRTVRDIGRRSDPDFERKLRSQAAEARPAMRQAVRGLAEALPAMTEALSAAASQMRQAVETMPRPDYPRR